MYYKPKPKYKIRDKRGKIAGIGINDVDSMIYKKLEDGTYWSCPYYKKWKHMLERCYVEKELIKHPTYRDCHVCEGWLTFSNFKTWMEKQDWEGKVLDKDLLVEGNKEYNPKYCTFVSSRLNSFLTLSTKTRGRYPVGCCTPIESKKGLRYRSICGGKHLGYFKTPDEAHNAWKIAKLGLCENFISENPRHEVLEGLLRVRLKLENSIKENTTIENL